METHNDRLPFHAKLGYGVGDFGANIVFQSVMLYLMFYLTDVFLIPATTAGTIVLVAKIWDAASDPLMGYLSDKTKSRWGQKRPYLLFGAVPLGVCMALLFYTPPLSENDKIVYATVIFLLVCTAYTVVNIPYGALTANLTLNADERSRLTGYRMFFALLGTLFVAGATKPIVALFADPVSGWRFLGLLYGSFAAFFTIITFFSVREKVQEKLSDEYTLKNIISVLKSNRPFLFLCLGVCMHLCAVGIVATMVNYLFRYSFKNEVFIPIAFLCMFAMAALSIPMWVYITNKLGKKHAFNIGMSLLAVILIVLFHIRTFNMVLFVGMFIIAGICLSTVFLHPWAMIPDTVEYSQWKTGIRREGIIYGFFYFSHKLAAACAGFMTGIGLTLANYLQPVMDNNVLTAQPQTQDTIFGIHVLTTIVPTIFIVAGVICISFYPIDAKMHARLVDEIEKRDRSAAV